MSSGRLGNTGGGRGTHSTKSPSSGTQTKLAIERSSNLVRQRIPVQSSRSVRVEVRYETLAETILFCGLSNDPCLATMNRYSISVMNLHDSAVGTASETSIQSLEIAELTFPHAPTWLGCAPALVRVANDASVAGHPLESVGRSMKHPLTMSSPKEMAGPEDRSQFPVEEVPSICNGPNDTTPPERVPRRTGLPTR